MDFFDIFIFFIDYLKYNFFCLILFIVGSVGVFITRKNIIVVLMSIELMLLSVNLLFIFLSIYLDDIVGQVFSLYILTIAAAESSIGLALIVIYYRIRYTIAIDLISTIKG